MLQRIVKAARAFFSSSEWSNDPLVDVVRRDSRAASLFIRIVMIVSGFGSLVVCAASVLFLSLFWTRCRSCDRPLRWWLLVHTVLQLVQIPVRGVFLLKMQKAEARGNSIEACVALFTASPAWRVSKNVSLFTYGWFVLGIVWVVNVRECSACPGVYRMTICMVLQAVARAMVALVSFRVLFSSSEEQQGEAPKVEAATPEQIALLPLVTFSDKLFPEKGTSCAVCLSDFARGECLRRLPCRHHFHRRCADQWLVRSKRCPLCMQGIDVSPCGGSRSTKKVQ